MLGKLSQMQYSYQFSITKMFEVFFEFWDDIVTKIYSKSISVPLMDILQRNKYKKFNNIHEIYILYRKQSVEMDSKALIEIQNKFDEYKEYLRLIKSFQSIFAFETKYNNKDLLYLEKIVSDIGSKWTYNQFTIKQLFKIDFKIFDIIRNSLEILDKYKNSKIAIQIWYDIIDNIQSSWSMKKLKDMNTFEISVWLRNQHRKKFILNENEYFNCEIIIHWIFDHEIDGIKLGMYVFCLMTVKIFFCKIDNCLHQNICMICTLCHL